MRINCSNPITIFESLLSNMNQQLQKIFARLTAIGAASGDSDDLRLQKSLLVMFTFPFLIAGVVWGIMYFMFGEKSAAIIPLSYAVVKTMRSSHTIGDELPRPGTCVFQTTFSVADQLST